jgi:hypothetical protein
MPSEYIFSQLFFWIFVRAKKITASVCLTSESVQQKKMLDSSKKT